MAHEVRWSTPALLDLEALCDSIAQDDPRAADRLANKIEHLVEGLVEHPRIGRKVPEFNREDLRERIYGLYRIVYRLLGEATIEVVAIHPAARPLPESL